MANLFKTFTKAVVWQVGKDTGRLVSNSLYGDKHATPIRHIGKSGEEELFFIVGERENKVEISADEYRAMKEADGWKVQYLFLGDSVGMNIWGWFLKIILFLICFPLSAIFIGIIPPLWMSIAKFRKKNIKMYKNELMESYTQDRRYRSGMRFNGYSMQKNEIIMPVNQKDKRILMIYGFIYLVVSLFFFATFIYCIFTNYYENF